MGKQPPLPTLPPRKGKCGKATTGKKSKRFKSDSDDESEHPASSSSSSLGEDPLPKKKAPPPKTKAVPGPKEKGGGGKKEQGGGKEGGGRKRRGGGGGNDPLVGTTAHVPYGGGAKVGTATGVHTRKSGVVSVKYPNNPKLYQVERHLIFGTTEAAEAQLQKVDPHHQAPQRSSLIPRITLKKTLNPTKAPPPNHLTPGMRPNVPRHSGTRKWAREWCST